MVSKPSTSIFIARMRGDKTLFGTKEDACGAPAAADADWTAAANGPVRGAVAEVAFVLPAAEAAAIVESTNRGPSAALNST